MIEDFLITIYIANVMKFHTIINSFIFMNDMDRIRLPSLNSMVCNLPIVSIDYILGQNTIKGPKVQNCFTKSIREKSRIEARLKGFEPSESIAWNKLEQKFGNQIKRNDLINLATVLSTIAQCDLDRDAKRRKSVLIRWFDENWFLIEKYIDRMILSPFGFVYVSQ